MSQIEKRSVLLVGGGIVAGLVSSLCCIGPLVLTIMGVSGAASLARFEYLRMPMIGVVILLFGAAGYGLFRKRKTCKPGSICADPRKYRNMVIVYFIGLIFAIAWVTSPNWVVWIYQ